MTREEAIEQLSSNLNKIGRFGVERIGLFGSFARLESRPGSDIDVLVRFAKGGKTFDNYMGLKFYLESLFAGHSIDLVIEDALKKRIRESVRRDAIYAS